MQLLIKYFLFQLKFAFTFIILLSFNTLFAQEKKQQKNSTYISADLTSMVYGNSPRYTFGYLTSISEKFMIGLDFGYGSYALLGSYWEEKEGLDQGYNLFEIRPRINYILNPKNNRSKTYISAEFFYINHKDIFINTTQDLKLNRYINTNSGYIMYDQANFYRQKYGVNFVFGMLIDLFKNFGVNFNIGLGVRNRKITYKNIINAQEFTPQENEALAIPIHLAVTGDVIGANVSLNLKLYYKF